MSIPATEMRYRLGHLHRALLRAGVMGLSAVTSAECSRDLRCAAHVPEEVPKRTHRDLAHYRLRAVNTDPSAALGRVRV
jgi:hypothetical protein